MFFDLVVCELEDLKAVLERRLCCFGLGEVVGHLLVGECLFDVLVIEVDNSVAIREAFSFDAVVEDHFLLAISVHPLDFTIVTDDLFDDLGVHCVFGMVFFWVLQTVVFFFCPLDVPFQPIAYVMCLLIDSLLSIVLIPIILLVRGILGFFFRDPFVV